MRHEAKMNASQNYGLPSSLVYRVSSMTENWVSSRDDFHPGAIEAPWDRTPRLSSKSQPRWTFFNMARTVLVSAIVFAGWLGGNAHAHEAVVPSKASDHHSMTELGHVRMVLDPIFVADLAGEKYRIGGHASIEIGIVGLEVAAKPSCTSGDWVFIGFLLIVGLALGSIFAGAYVLNDGFRGRTSARITACGLVLLFGLPLPAAIGGVSLLQSVGNSVQYCHARSAFRA
jgi:hypothetical protein